MEQFIFMETPIPKFGILTNPFMNMVSEIRDIHDREFDYVEIGIEAPGGMPEIIIENKKKILSLLKKFSSPPLGHTGWMVDLGTPYDDVRRAWIAEGKRYMDIAKELGISLINFHGSSYLTFFDSHGMKKEVLDNYVKSLRELIDYGKKLGMTVMLENMPNEKQISAINDYKYVIDRVKGLWVHLDIAHAHIDGGIKNVEKFVKTFDKKITHVHFSDNLGSDDHLPIGKGNIDYDKVVKLLKKTGYSKTITFEVFTENRHDAVKSREKIEKMWSNV